MGAYRMIRNRNGTRVITQGLRGLQGAPGSNGVTSFNTRIGAVIPQGGDYAAFYQPLATNLTNYAALTLGNNNLAYTNAAGVLSLATLTSFARSILDDVDAAGVRGTLGLGTMAVESAATYATLANPTFTGTAAFASVTVSGTLTGLPSPTANNEAATKGYVDTLLAGLKWKQSVQVATVSNGNLATAFAAGQVVDGAVLSTGNRILIKNQFLPPENGIYTVNASGTPTRATDADTGTELVSAAVFVQYGSTNADKAFVCTNDSITIGSTSIVFVAFASVVGALIAANNLSDLPNTGTARTNLGLSTMAQQSHTNVSILGGTISVHDMRLRDYNGMGTAGDFVWLQANNVANGARPVVFTPSDSGSDLIITFGVNSAVQFDDGVSVTFNSSGTLDFATLVLQSGDASLNDVDCSMLVVGQLSADTLIVYNGALFAPGNSGNPNLSINNGRTANTLLDQALDLVTIYGHTAFDPLNSSYDGATIEFSGGYPGIGGNPGEIRLIIPYGTGMGTYGPVRFCTDDGAGSIVYEVGRFDQTGLVLNPNSYGNLTIFDGTYNYFKTADDGTLTMNPPTAIFIQAITYFQSSYVEFSGQTLFNNSATAIFDGGIQLSLAYIDGSSPAQWGFVDVVVPGVGGKKLKLYD